MKPSGRITKETKVRDAEKLLMVPHLEVREDESIEDMAKKVAFCPACKVIAVVDANRVLRGIIPVSLLLDDIFLRIMPEEFLVDLISMNDIVSFARGAVVSTAGDLMQAPVSVKMDNTVKDAFDHMHKNHLSGLPIVDDQNRLIGHVDMLELLLVWLKSRENE